ncbi:MAG: sulfatase-like hydrolase/transferase [Aliishimia sp.]
MRKNILLISMDDAISYWHYRKVFGKSLETPNLDRICGQSAAFHSAYCQAPLCGPSRASFMSSRTPHDTGVFDNRTNIFDVLSPKEMWSHQLRDNGYYCSSGGKVHHKFRPLPQDVHEVLYDDEPKHFRIDIRLPQKKSQVRLGGHAAGLATTDREDDGYYYDAHSSASFAKFLDAYDDDRPFYREVGFFGPHGPFITPLRFKKLYRLSDLKQPKAWADGYDQNAFAEENIKPNFNTKKTRYWKQSVRNYFSAFSHVDHHIGKVWDALKQSRHAGTTLVVILADHGFHLGEKNRFRKTSLWEQVSRVPLIIHDPDNPAPREIKDPVALLDVGKTVLDYVDVPPLDQHRGVSLRPLIEGRDIKARVVPTFHRGSIGIRKGNHRLIRYEDCGFELFDLKRDWWQLKNLGSEHPAFADLMPALVTCARDNGLDIPATA